MQSKKRGLGKGLSALLPVGPPPATPAEADEHPAPTPAPGDAVRHVPLDGVDRKSVV